MRKTRTATLGSQTPKLFNAEGVASDHHRVTVSLPFVPHDELRDVLWIPLPFIYPLARTIVNLIHDLDSPEYQDYIRGMTEALRPNKPFVFSSGHEHNLQVLDGVFVSEYLLVSGSGTIGNQTTAGHGRNTLFAHFRPGFMVLDLLQNGSVFLRVIEPSTQGSDKTRFSMWLRH